jgi:arsenate reductase
MAEGLLSHWAADRFAVESAGTKPGSVRAEAITVMKELGIDISAHRSKHLDEFKGQAFDYVLTVCDNANESCPVFPGRAKRIHKAFEDPAAFQGTEEERLASRLPASTRSNSDLSAKLPVLTPLPGSRVPQGPNDRSPTPQSLRRDRGFAESGYDRSVPTGRLHLRAEIPSQYRQPHSH